MMYKGRLQKKNLIVIFQLGSRPPPLLQLEKKKKKFICLFHVLEHFKATFFYFFSQLENDLDFFFEAFPKGHMQNFIVLGQHLL